jgi:hypothetical protein
LVRVEINIGVDRDVGASTDSMIVKESQQMSTYPAYVYKITVKETGEFYFGFRKRNIAEPVNDLLVNYFSSSKTIKSIIECQGLNAVSGEIIFTSFEHEQSLIEQHQGNPLLLNQQFQKPNMGFKMFISTEESTRKMLETRTKRGTQKTKKWIENQRVKHNKRYLVTSPNGETYEIFGLKAHCQKHGLNHPAMAQVGLGKKPHHKGWKCKRLS